MTDKKNDIRLYILMRNDMDSMNAGKAVAQGSHAANQMVHEANNAPRFDYMLKEWQGMANGFGTCIVLGCSGKQMESIIEDVSNNMNIHSGICHDPSYPIKDGAVVHHIALDTCAYLFGHYEEISHYVKDLSLMP